MSILTLSDKAKKKEVEIKNMEDLNKLGVEGIEGVSKSTRCAYKGEKAGPPPNRPALLQICQNTHDIIRKCE